MGIVGRMGREVVQAVVVDDEPMVSTPPEDLIGLVRVAADGHTVLSPVAARRMLASASGEDETRKRPSNWSGGSRSASRAC